VAKNPDPTLKVTSSKGVVRTLDDWTTIFHLVLVALPDRPEAAAFIPVAKRIFATFGDADCKVGFLVTADEEVTRRVLGDAEETVFTLTDPECELVQSLGLRQLPALVHIRQDTSLGAVAEGWDPVAWQRAARSIAKDLAWTTPEVSGPGDPRPGTNWPAIRP
jgi:hypothetical protein